MGNNLPLPDSLPHSQTCFLGMSSKVDYLYSNFVSWGDSRRICLVLDSSYIIQYSMLKGDTCYEKMPSTLRRIWIRRWRTRWWKAFEHRLEEDKETNHGCMWEKENAEVLKQEYAWYMKNIKGNLCDCNRVSEWSVWRSVNKVREVKKKKKGIQERQQL